MDSTESADEKGDSSPLGSRPWQGSGMRSAAEGFWIAATPVDPDLTDQTFQSIGERARFYEGSLPPALRERLARLDQVGPGREAEFSEPFARAYDSVIAIASIGNKPLARRRARLEKMGGVRGAPRDGAGLSFLHHPPGHGLHWGSINAIFDCSLAMPSHHKAYWRAGAATQGRCRELCARMCELMLDEVERAWGLGTALARHARDDERVHWGEDYAPSCQDPASDAPARAALEARQLAQAANPGGRRAPRRPL